MASDSDDNGLGRVRMEEQSLDRDYITWLITRLSLSTLITSRSCPRVKNCWSLKVAKPSDCLILVCKQMGVFMSMVEWINCTEQQSSQIVVARPSKQDTMLCGNQGRESELIVSQMFKLICTFCGTSNFNSVFTTSKYLISLWANLINTTNQNSHKRHDFRK
jgi:hypothetical protein